MKTLFKNARILSMNDEFITSGDLLVIDTRIAYIGNESEQFGPFDRVIDCQNNLLMPGFKNAHAHSAMVFIKTKNDNVTLQDWLYKIVFPREEKLIPSDVYHLNKVAYLDYVRGGITACFDHYFFPLEAYKAAEEFGMRTLLLATCNPGKVSIDDLEKNYHAINDKEAGLVKYIIGFHAEYTADDSLLEETKVAIEKFKCPFYTHISETQKEVGECLMRHDRTPFMFLYEQGYFKYGGGGFHCVHLTDLEVEICKENNLNIISCPGSNLKLSSGTAPLTKYLKAGINIALGTDGPASNDGLDMFREMRLAATNNNKEIKSFDIIKMATVNGAIAMGFPEADVLDVDKAADIILIDLHAENMDPNADIFDNIVYNGKKENVLLTMINGKLLYEDGHYHINESVESINKKAEEISRRIENEL